MTKLRFNKTLLDEICTRDKCQVDLTQEQYDALNRDTQISFVCGSVNCNEKEEKMFRYIHDHGGFCTNCMKGIKKDKFKNTSQVKFGTDNPFQNAEIKQKIIDTMQEKYQVDHPLQSPQIQEKFKNTCQERFGVDHPFQNPEVKQKILETLRERYDVDHPLQNAEVNAKSLNNSFKSKMFTFPCGNVLQVQGFEPFALEVLVKHGRTFEEITTDRTRVPEIWYETEDKKKHRYFCDILLHNEDKIIEVKSDWTYKQGEETIIPLKAQACIDEGFEYEIWIFDGKKNLTIQTYDKPIASFSEMLFV